MIGVLWRLVMQDALGDVLELYPQLQWKVYVDDIKIHVWRENNEVLQAVPKVVGKVTRLSYL